MKSVLFYVRLVSCLEKVAKTVTERIVTGDLSC